MRDYLNKLRMQFQHFMIGRYGMDQFGRFFVRSAFSTDHYELPDPSGTAFQDLVGTGMDRAHCPVCKNVFKEHQ